MYPSILRDMEFPTKFRFWGTDMAPEDLVALCGHRGVIARVTVDTQVGEYPRRSGERSTYPIGRFVTTLAGPDIQGLARDGKIVKVHEYALYDMGRPFKRAIDTLIRARNEADPTAEIDEKALAKLVANSLGGRLAMRSGKWAREPLLDNLQRWGEYFSISASTERETRTRYLAGIAWRWKEDELPKGPFTFAFAYLTAYGRQMMWALRRLCPPKSVVAQSTDGLYLLPEAVRTLTAAGMLTDRGPGTLRVVDTADSGHWYGPRHYRYGNKWVLSGLAQRQVDSDKLTIKYSSRLPLCQSRERTAPTSVHTIHRTVMIPSDYGDGRVQEDGWILPPHVIARKEK